MVTLIGVLFSMTLVVTSAMALTVSRRVLIFVPIVIYKVDRLATSVVLAAILSPVFLVFCRHAHVDWLLNHTRWRGLYQDWLRIDHLWLWEVADVDAAIEAGLANLDGNADIGGNSRRGDEGHSCDQRTEEMLHGEGHVVNENRITCMCANSMTKCQIRS
jgi:hypothetical protein